MTASFTTFTGFSNADSKSYPTQPSPRLTGSAITLPPYTGVGTPTVTTSHVHPSAAARTPSTSCCGTSDFPDSNRRGSSSPEASSLTCEPPTSIASTVRRSATTRPGYGTETVRRRVGRELFDVARSVAFTSSCSIDGDVYAAATRALTGGVRVEAVARLAAESAGLDVLA